MCCHCSETIKERFGRVSSETGFIGELKKRILIWYKGHPWLDAKIFFETVIFFGETGWMPKYWHAKMWVR